MLRLRRQLRPQPTSRGCFQPDFWTVTHAGQVCPALSFCRASGYFALMKAPLIFSIAAVAVLAGCGQSSNSSKTGTNAAAGSGSPVDAPADYLRAAVNAQQAAVKTVDTASVQRAIQMFSVEEGRYPKDLDELVQKKF